MTMLQTSSHPPMATTKPQRETARLQRHALLGYSLLAYGWIWLAMVGIALALQFNFVPADSPRLGLINQVAAFGPAMAALIVIARTEGFRGVGVWLRRLVQWRGYSGISLLSLASPCSC